MGVARAVVQVRAVLERLLDGLPRDAPHAVRVRRRRKDRRFQGVERDAGVTADRARQRRDRLVIDGDGEAPEAAVGVSQRPAQDDLDLLWRELVQREDAASGQQRPDHFERRILRGRADEDDRSVLHVGQDGVLLGLVEAMNLVDEQNGAPAGRKPRAGLRHDPAQVRHAGGHR